MSQNQFKSNSSQNDAKIMDLEQFNCVVNAILEGRYSWACVLILRFAGYNPAHYIPYRTYKRLIQENRQRQKGEQPVQTPVSDAENSQALDTLFLREHIARH